MKPLRVTVITLCVLTLVAVATFAARGPLRRAAFAPTASVVPSGVVMTPEDGVLPSEPSAPRPAIEVIAEGLDIPWEIVFLPDGSMLVTERSGTLVHIGEDRKVIPVPGVRHVGEGGLLGMALHPEFAQNDLLYLYLTSNDSGRLENRVERYVYRDGALSEREVIVSGIPGAQYHDGGRIAFGPDGMLYVTTGDAGTTASAQNVQSLAGKILRFAPEGGIPEGNPFGNAVWSYGHRNPQGIAWDADGRLWSTEHGRSGVQSGYDELNRIEPGKNYGWPTIQGDAAHEGMERPVLHSGSSETWAPASAAYLDGVIWFGGLRGESLYAARLGEDGQSAELVAYLRGTYGRIRTVVVGPDDMLYLTTSNRDGRGGRMEGDDRIIRVDPFALR